MESTQDTFLGGQVLVRQPAKGYRAGVDAVLLAASIQAQPEERVLDVGCGVGTASLCLNARVYGLEIQGLDYQECLVAFAQQNAAPFKNVTFSYGALETARFLEKNSFDHVMTNPPYFKKDCSTVSNDPIKDKANFESLDLVTWISLCLKYVKPQGTLTLIHCATRLDEILCSISIIKSRSITIIPIWPAREKPANRVIVRITKDKRASLVLSPGLVMHRAGTYTEETQGILRNGAPLLY